MRAALNDCAIDVRGVTKLYRFYRRPADRLWQAIFPKKQYYSHEVTVLESVSFSVQRGETVGIIGRNGAGKTTLLQIIAGTLQASAGTVTKRGRVAPLIELGSGFNPEFTGRENVIFSGTLLGMTSTEIAAKYDEIVAFADIGDYIERPVKTYSSGMYARLAFSVAVHIEPEILIVDEILSVGDAAFQRKCMNRFYQVRDRGCTILLVGHDEYMIRAVCQKALYLKQGRMVAFGNPVDVVGRYVDDTMTAPAVSRTFAPPAVEVVSSAAVTSSETEKSSAGAGPSLSAPLTNASSTLLGDQAVIAEPTRSRDDSPTAIGTNGDAGLTIEHTAVESAARAIQASAVDTPDKVYRISNVVLLDDAGRPTDTVHHGDTIHLEFAFEALTGDTPNKMSFVFNLYAVTGEYVCGSTSLMEGFDAHVGARAGRVRVTFPSLKLLTGKYHWRVAINDGVGLQIFQHAVYVCPFRVIVDDYKSAGLVHLDRKWHFQLLP